ncbi:hypothetical protein QTP86_028690 [Hemibagrus guttatus]|nr:hypothetical protein QTP86_028690 [Hemibagrus guttatus]
MAGGPQKWNNISEPGTVNIDVRGGGVQTGAILRGNLFQGNVTSRTNYTGPPPGDGAGPVAPREQNEFDGSMNYVTRPSVHFTVQPAVQINDEERDEDRIDLR